MIPAQCNCIKNINKAVQRNIIIVTVIIIIIECKINKHKRRIKVNKWIYEITFITNGRGRKYVMRQESKEEADEEEEEEEEAREGGAPDVPPSGRSVTPTLLFTNHRPAVIVKMSTIQTLRAFVNQRLAAAVEEIFGLLETTISKYEEEIERQRGLLKDADGHTHTADVRKLIVRKEDQQEWRSCLYPGDIKEEQEELWSSQQGEQLQGLEEDDITKFPFTAVSVKIEDDNEDKTQSLQLHQTQSEESREAEPPASSSAHQMETETGSTHQLQSLYCCESETEDSNDEWKDAREQEKNENALNHSKSHTRARPFSCTVCDKKFGCKGNLHAHMRSHTGEKPFTCTVCNKSFSAKVNLKTHMRSHTGEKPFSCSMCNKSFSQKKTLVIHLRSHTGERPFSCSFCGKRFSEKGTLKRHIRVHTGEKPYSCSVCGRNFSLLSHVKSHKCAGVSSNK